MKTCNFILVLLFIPFLLFSQNKPVNLSGKIVDTTKESLPYVGIGILSKNIGTSSNDDGDFYLKLTQENLEDILTISTIGFKTVKIKVQDFINQKEKVIVLIEDVVSLDEITLVKPSYYVKRAIKNVKKTTLRTPHQLSILYRRFSTENNTPRFLVEHYVNVLDKGLTIPAFEDFEVVQGRKSVDYRYVKRKQNFHAIAMVAKQNLIRRGLYASDYKWKITGDSSYDGEELIIVEGKNKDNQAQFVRLYIGLETYGIYKYETSINNAVYIYKKNNEGKLYLSYHNREWKSEEPISDYLKNLLKLKTNTISLSYRHEAVILGLETESKKINIRTYGKGRTDIGDLKIKYNPIFWKNLSMPPDSKFYLKNKKELEGIFGVPLETQFKVIN